MLSWESKRGLGRGHRGSACCDRVPRHQCIVAAKAIFRRMPDHSETTWLSLSTVVDLRCTGDPTEQKPWNTPISDRPRIALLCKDPSSRLSPQAIQPRNSQNQRLEVKPRHHTLQCAVGIPRSPMHPNPHSVSRRDFLTTSLAAT